jgi:rhodanese-related sulfurtransferase
MGKEKASIFQDKGFIIDHIRFLSPKEAHHALLSGATLIDLRKEYEINYRVFDIPKVINITREQIQDQIKTLKKYSPIILADNVGLETKAVAVELKNNGINDVACLIGGIIDWVKDNLPIKKDPAYELVGQCSCQLRPKKK